MLVAENLGKRFGPQVLFEGVSVAIEAGQRVGLVGANGSGKSTLGKVLAGIEPSDTGQVHTKRGFRLAYLTQEPTFGAAQTPREAVVEALGPWTEAKSRFDAASECLADASQDEAAHLAAMTEQGEAMEALEQAGGFAVMHEVEEYLEALGVQAIDGPLAGRSGGERRRVALAALLCTQPDLAILDEPTNHLDIGAIEWLEKHLSERFTGALLLITHDRYLLDAVVSRTLELAGGQLFSFEGGWDAYLEQKAERELQASRTEANRQNFLRTELEWLRASPKARTTKSRSRVDRAEAAIASKPKSDGPSLVLRGQSQPRLGSTILECDNLSLSLGGKTLIKDFTFQLTQDERVGIIGPNGAGKTSLFRTFLGQLEPSAGEVRLGKHTRFAYLSQMRDNLDPELSIQEAVAKDGRQVILNGEAVDVRGYLQRFRFDGAKQRQKVSALSGGERARVSLARLLLEPANVLLLDEPSNDLDVATLSALEEMLTAPGRTAIVVTHDRYFLDRVATQMLVFEGSGRVTRYAGNYGDYLLQAASASRAASAAPAKSTPPKRVTSQATTPQRAAAPAQAPGDGATPSTSAAPVPKRLTVREEEELAGMLVRIEAAEQALEAVENKLNDPEVYLGDGAAAATLERQADEARGQLEALMERWEALEARRPA